MSQRIRSWLNDLDECIEIECAFKGNGVSPGCIQVKSNRLGVHHQPDHEAAEKSCWQKSKCPYPIIQHLLKEGEGV